MKGLRFLPLLLLGAIIAAGFAMTPEARRSFEAFRQRALSGDSAAQYRYSQILERGYDSIAPDTALSLGMLRRSAEKGFPQAMNYLGYLYGEGVKAGGKTLLRQDADSMAWWLGRAAEAGDPKAIFNLGFLMLRDSTLAGDSLSHAASLVYKAAGLGVPDAMTLTGDLFRDGRGLPLDTVKAEEWYEKGIIHRARDAEPRLVAMMGRKWMALDPDSAYRRGMGLLGYAPSAAFILFENSSKLPELPDSAFDYPGKHTSYIPSDSVADVADSSALETRERVRKGLERAAHSMALMAEAYSRGYGVPYNHDEGLKWYAKAAMAGDPTAAEVLDQTLQLFPDAIAGFSDELGYFRERLAPVLRFLE